MTALPIMPRVAKEKSAPKGSNARDVAFKAGTTMRDSASLLREALLRSLSEAKDNFRKKDNVRWQWSGATWTTDGCPQGERGGVHQFGVPSKTAVCGSAFQKSKGTQQAASEARDNSANFAWVQHFNSVC